MNKEKKTKKKIIWKILLFIGTLPFVIILVMSIINAINGFEFLFSTSYGWEAFIGTAVIYSFLFWPAYIVGILLIILSIIMLVRLSCGT